MLAMADQDGIVYATIPGLADRARISIDKCEEALRRFQEPDKYSWSKEEEGRRLKVVEGGWFLVNHAKYRALMSYEEQKEKTRIRVARHRAHKATALQALPVTEGHECNDNISNNILSNISSKAEVKSSVRFTVPLLCQVVDYCQERKNQVDPQHFMDYYEANGWRVGKNPMKSWKAAVRTWEKNGFTKPAIWRNGDVPSKREQHEQRIRDNQEVILAGLGLSKGSGPSEQGVQSDLDGAGSPHLAKLLRR